MVEEKVLEFVARRTADLDHQMAESSRTKWTNEKHSSYLNSMEASFVRQLHSAKTRVSSGQFKVQQQGCWKQLNFDLQPRLVNVDDSPICMNSPWIQRFKSVGKGQDASVQNLHKVELQFTENASESQLCPQDSACSNEEVSGQNFLDEDHEQEQISGLCRIKRIKCEVSDASTFTDQVVPTGINSNQAVSSENERRTAASQFQAVSNDEKSESMEDLVHEPNGGDLLNID